MGVPYDTFIGAFLSKVTEYDFPMRDFERNEIIDGYMKRAIVEFKTCKYDFETTGDDVVREFDVELEDGDSISEIADIVSDGMVVQWLKPYVYRQENLENMLNTKDFSGYSPANLLNSIRDTHSLAKRDFTNKVREYSYDHGDLTDLHL